MEGIIDTKNISLLFVEDDDFSRKLLTMAMNGKRFGIAKTGQEAVQMFRSLAPDIVFLDIQLPDVDGIGVLQAIKKIDPSAYVVMLTSTSDKSVVMKCIQKGARGFIVKPFSPRQFNEYIERYACEKSLGDFF